MAGLQLLPTSPQRAPPPADELSDLSTVMAQEEERERAVEYHMVEREEAAGMPPNFPHSVGGRFSGYGAISSPRAAKRRRRGRRKGSRPQSGGGFAAGLVSPQSHYSLQPHALREDHHHYYHHLQEPHRRFFSTTALPQVSASTHTHTHTMSLCLLYCTLQLISTGAFV